MLSRTGLIFSGIFIVISSYLLAIIVAGLLILLDVITLPVAYDCHDWGGT
ncbi:MAG: hypothetical protein OES09_05185 [Gammaproteobacteria bacterium]|nr:hypothetical protein [Gammaproteobacteria bacterium]